jgi:hypothetical protein
MTRRAMELRCKVIRGENAGTLEQAVNHFLSEELSNLGEVQFEEITQSESVAGVTVVIWYSVVNERSTTLEELEGLDEGHAEGLS